MTKEQHQKQDMIVRMMMATAKKNGLRSDHFYILRFAERLHRLESVLNKLAVDQCNGANYDSKKQDRIEKLACKIIKETLGCECYTQRDPRGFCIRLYLVDEYGRKWFNSWDGETTGLDW